MALSQALDLTSDLKCVQFGLLFRFEMAVKLLRLTHALLMRARLALYLKIPCVPPSASPDRESLR